MTRPKLVEAPCWWHCYGTISRVNMSLCWEALPWINFILLKWVVEKKPGFLCVPNNCCLPSYGKTWRFSNVRVDIPFFAAVSRPLLQLWCDCVWEHLSEVKLVSIPSPRTPRRPISENRYETIQLTREGSASRCNALAFWLLACSSINNNFGSFADFHLGAGGMNHTSQMCHNLTSRRALDIYGE